MLHIETGLDQCGTIVEQAEDGDIAFHNVITVTEYNSGKIVFRSAYLKNFENSIT